MAGASRTSTSNGGSSRDRLRGRVRMIRRQLDDFAWRQLVNIGAVVGAALLLGATSGWLQVLGALAGLASLAAIVWRRRRAWPRQRVDPPGTPTGALLGSFVSVRAVLFFALGAGYLLRRPDERGWIWAAVAVGALLVLCEPLTKSLLDVPKQIVLHLPGVRSVPEPPLNPSWLYAVTVVDLAVGTLLALLGAPGWLFLVLVLLGVPVTVLMVRHAVRANLTSKRAIAKIPSALRKLAPAFVVYYAASQGARYQLGMWLPYLERLGRTYVIITRNPDSVPVIRTLSRAPILVPRLNKISESLDSMIVPSMRAAFYVQGSPMNQTLQRYRSLTHVWLNHGDSDKQANFHPRHATYDQLFVSGQQAVERYARHGIEVAPERFVLIGRPQIENIQPRDAPLPPGTPRTVLYAPTWKGGRPSTNYSSLPMGTAMVRALLERGASVVFRPHPVSHEDAQDAKRIRDIWELLEADQVATAGSARPRQHVWGPKAEQEWDVADCFNASDALITDVSSIGTDYLASGKPFAMVAVTHSGRDFVREFPTAQVAYVIERDLSTLPDVLDHLLGDDTRAAERLAYREFCLGPVVGPEAAQEFLRVSRALLEDPAAPAGARRRAAGVSSAAGVAPAAGDGRP